MVGEWGLKIGTYVVKLNSNPCFLFPSCECLQNKLVLNQALEGRSAKNVWWLVLNLACFT